MDRQTPMLRPATGDMARLDDGQPWPLGASVDEQGVNFAVFSGHATRVDLCLFDATGGCEVARQPLPARSGDVWHGRLPGARAGIVYGLRAHGAWRPDRGHRFNPYKLLLDPWAREIVAPQGGFDWNGPHFGADRDFPQHMDMRDNAAGAFKARVVHDSFDWQGDRPLRTPLSRSVLYELHVRGFSKRMPGLPDALRGTYAGLAHPLSIAHLQRLGITAVSLLPVHQLLSEQRLAAHGLVNHWGYNTLGFFAPEPRYAATAQPRTEFREMVKALHAAGIEVILDVVFNHSCEGDERGPTLSWRGLDNASWYRLPPDAKDRFENYSGCGNTFDVRHPRVLQMVLDSLRYWVQEMHVDGFRFDLAPVLGRGDAGFDRDGPFFKAVLQDPTLQGTKMIAEPWDIGPGGYQVGQFPRGWLEWNDHFRDTTRAFWLGGDCTRGELALRLAGSSDLFQPRQRPPGESVNYIVSHDGFTLADLVSYDLKHNAANLEDNRDGHGHNLSWNCGWEGPTLDPKVLALRARLQRALLATVLLAQGTPMLAAGDELGHSQRGNNNPYCQDNAITWIDWSRADTALVDFTAHVLALRRRLLPLGTRWYTGLTDARGLPDLAWLRRVGEPMTPEHWNNRMSRVLGAFIGAPGGQGDGAGQPLLLLVNGRALDTGFALPPGGWVVELDTANPGGHGSWCPNAQNAEKVENAESAEGTTIRVASGSPPLQSYPLQSRSLVLLRDAGHKPRAPTASPNEPS